MQQPLVVTAAVFTACCCLLGISFFRVGVRTELLSEPFDSNMPVQWDSSAEDSLGGLSRYFTSPTANLRKVAPKGHIALAGKARTTQLALDSPRTRPAVAKFSAAREMERANRELKSAQAGMHSLLQGTSFVQMSHEVHGRLPAGTRLPSGAEREEQKQERMTSAHSSAV